MGTGCLCRDLSKVILKSKNYNGSRFPMSRMIYIDRKITWNLKIFSCFFWGGSATATGIRYRCGPSYGRDTQNIWKSKNLDFCLFLAHFIFSTNFGNSKLFLKNFFCHFRFLRFSTKRVKNTGFQLWATVKGYCVRSQSVPPTFFIMVPKFGSQTLPKNDAPNLTLNTRSSVAARLCLV